MHIGGMPFDQHDGDPFHQEIRIDFRFQRIHEVVDDASVTLFQIRGQSGNLFLVGDFRIVIDVLAIGIKAPIRERWHVLLFDSRRAIFSRGTGGGRI